MTPCRGQDVKILILHLSTNLLTYSCILGVPKIAWPCRLTINDSALLVCLSSASLSLVYCQCSDCSRIRINALNKSVLRNIDQKQPPHRDCVISLFAYDVPPAFRTSRTVNLFWQEKRGQGWGPVGGVEGGGCGQTDQSEGLMTRQPFLLTYWI